MTYAEKLRDPRWKEFRQAAFIFHGPFCTNCGSEYRSIDESIHVHHKRYINGKEPWEYHMSDVSVLCWECHKDIHDCENKWRDMIRHMPSYMVIEFNSMAEAFKGMKPETIRRWASYCKNEARKLKGYKINEE